MTESRVSSKCEIILLIETCSLRLNSRSGGIRNRLFRQLMYYFLLNIQAGQTLRVTG